MSGWQVPAFALSGKASNISIIRIMCRRGFQMDFATLLMRDFKAALEFSKEPPAAPRSRRRKGPASTTSAAGRARASVAAALRQVGVPRNR